MTPTQRFRNLSRFHRHYRSNPPAVTPPGERLKTRIDNVFRRVRQRKKKTARKRSHIAPFRVKVESKTGAHERSDFYHHPIDAIKRVCDVLARCLRDEIIIYVQKRKGSSDDFHSGPGKLHLAVMLTRDWGLRRPRFGLGPFCDRFKVATRKTRLPDFCEAINPG